MILLLPLAGLGAIILIAFWPLFQFLAPVFGALIALVIMALRALALAGSLAALGWYFLN